MSYTIPAHRHSDIQIGAARHENSHTYAKCRRCGIERQVQITRGIPELCRDCRDVENYVNQEIDA